MDPRRMGAILEAEHEREAQAQARLEPTALDFLPWTEQHVRLRGKRFSLQGHEYLEEPYQDDHPDQTDQKAAQVGASTRAMLRCFHTCDRYGAKALYYLSTDDDADDFSQDRVSVAIEESEHLQALLQVSDRGRDNVGLRHVGRGSFYLRGVMTKRKVKSVDGDLIVLDETDEADQENLEFALDRVLASDLAQIMRLSQPSIPDFGINAAFKETDQRHWHLICPACGEYNCLELNLEDQDGRLIPKNFLEIPETLRHAAWVVPGQRWYRACLACHAPLDMGKGEWVARYPSIVEKRGRQWSQLYRQRPMPGFPTAADGIMDRLLGARKTRQKMRNAISIIGVPYGGDRQPITETELDRCESENAFAEQGYGCYMGIDQGDELHIVIGRDTPSGRPEVIHLEHTEDWSAIARLRKRFGVVATVGDAMPNKKTMKDQALASPRDFWIQYFSEHHADPKDDVEGEGQRQVKKVLVSRDESLDETVDWIVHGELLLPCLLKLTGKELALMEQFRDHCQKLVKDLVEGARGILRWSYQKNVPNHFGMALNSMRIARQLHRGEQVDYDQMATSGRQHVAVRGPEIEEDSRHLAMRADEDLNDLSRMTTSIFSEFSY